jgi:hypothetical protein
MTEHSIQEKQFDLLHVELQRIADSLEALQARMSVLENIPSGVHELARLTGALESLAYAALGREGPTLRRRA